MVYTDYLLDKIIICDIDETIAHLNGRGYYDWDKVKFDTINTTIRDLLRRYAKDHSIVFITGRSEVCREDTLKWLEDYEVPMDELHMKPKGVGTDSAIFKAEVVKELLKKNPEATISFALDDRQKIVDAFKEIGIVTFLV